MGIYLFLSGSYDFYGLETQNCSVTIAECHPDKSVQNLCERYIHGDWK